MRRTQTAILPPRAQRRVRQGIRPGPLCIAGSVALAVLVALGWWYMLTITPVPESVARCVADPQCVWPW